jgi:hypothetical protein
MVMCGEWTALPRVSIGAQVPDQNEARGMSGCQSVFYIKLFFWLLCKQQSEQKYQKARPPLAEHITMYEKWYTRL